MPPMAERRGNVEWKMLNVELENERRAANRAVTQFNIRHLTFNIPPFSMPAGRCVDMHLVSLRFDPSLPPFQPPSLRVDGATPSTALDTNPPA